MIGGKPIQGRESPLSSVVHSLGSPETERRIFHSEHGPVGSADILVSRPQEPKSRLNPSRTGRQPPSLREGTGVRTGTPDRGRTATLFTSCGRNSECQNKRGAIGRKESRGHSFFLWREAFYKIVHISEQKEDPFLADLYINYYKNGFGIHTNGIFWGLQGTSMLCLFLCL